jgi:S1-C subfamily serine protease
MTDPSTSQLELWRQRWQHIRGRAWSAAPFASGVFAALGALLLYNLLFPGDPPLTTRDVDDSIVQALASVTPAPAYSAQVYQAIQPSLVLIQVKAPDEEGEPGNGIGSGVVINQAGDILTSLHVVANASEIELIFADGSESTAQIVGAQPENDIAVLRADQPPELLVPAILGNPRAMRVGDEAFVVGHPLGLYGSMSAGVISGFDRSFTPPDGEQKLHNLIQIDAAVNPGNSGGPLLNSSGQVVGNFTALVNPTQQEVFIGIGFATPINIAGAAVGLPPY